MNAQTNLPAERAQVHPIVRLSSQLEQRGDEFKKALPSHISPEKMQRTIVTAATNNPDLLRADRQSLVTSAMKAAQDGLLPDGREAALVVFNTRKKNEHGQWESVKEVQYMPMVYGLRKKIVQSGEVVSLQTGLVYRAELEGGAFLYEVGLEPPIRHRPMLVLPAEELTDDHIVAAYSMAKMKDGTVSVEVMRRGEIDRVREASMTGATKDRSGKPRESKGPWVEWFGEMARKTVMRRHSKTLPMSGDIFVDVEGQEHEAATSAARVLDSIQADAPLALPSTNDDSDAAQDDEPARDPATGMTEVDEETARSLDAGESYDEQTGEVIEGEARVEDTGEQQPQPPETDHTGPKPEGAQHGQSWFNPEDGKVRYAHQTANGGIKWYLAPPKEQEPEQEPQSEAEAAQETVQQINGPLDQDEQQADDRPPWADKIDWLRKNIPLADKTSLKALNADFENHMAVLPDEIVAEIDALFNARRRALSADA